MEDLFLQDSTVAFSKNINES